MKTKLLITHQKNRPKKQKKYFLFFKTLFERRAAKEEVGPLSVLNQMRTLLSQIGQTRK